MIEEMLEAIRFDERDLEYFDKKIKLYMEKKMYKSLSRVLEQRKVLYETMKKQKEVAKNEKLG